jgi:tRNA-modifying protein YgfZ
MLERSMQNDPIRVRALANGFADLSSWRKTQMSGDGALAWLDNIVSADLDGLAPSHARRTLLLSPTGGVRAEFTVSCAEGALLLIQDPVQPRSIGDLLAPYVLSSGVQLRDRSDELALFAFPDRAEPPDVPGATPSVPSCVGTGSDLIFQKGQRDRVLARLGTAFVALSPEDIEAWRVANGISRFGLDGSEEDLPQEAGLEDAVSFGKGCFTGQEAVAKVRNLGHPRRLVVTVEADSPLHQGEDVVCDGAAVGAITSAAGTVGLAKVRWSAREGPLRTASGTQLRLRS